MTGHDKWRTVLAYAIGIIILAVCLVLVLFLPNWYGSWQDKQLTGKVILERRENIEFLDGDSLDIAGRMKKLNEAASIEWNFNYGADSSPYIEDWNYANSKLESNMRRCKELIKEWWEAGLLPQDCSQWIAEDGHLLFYSEPVLYIKDSVLPVCFFILFNEQITDEGAELADSDAAVMETTPAVVEDNLEQLMILMDAEKDLIYYVSLTGSAMQDKMIQELGYTSEHSLIEDIQNGTRKLKRLDTTGYDFAAVCGADKATITTETGQLELLVSLRYDNYDVYAGRSLVCNETGYGQAILFGTPRWPSLIRQLLNFNVGADECLMTTELWCDLLLAQVLNDEAMYILDRGQSSDGVNSEVFQYEMEDAADEQISQ